MARNAYLIPPSSHFLKSFTNFSIANLPLNSVSASRYYIVFPTKRASLFYKFYLIEKLQDRSFVLPRILSWEEFLLELYAQSTKVPFRLLPDYAKILFLIPVLKDLGISWTEPEKLLFWTSRFLEVFEEFEKEGRIPENLYYPPETLPEQAKVFFEKLARAYELYSLRKEEKQIIFPSDLVSAILKNHEKLDFFLSSIKGIFFAGFVALRKAELEIMSLLNSELQKRGVEPVFLFEDTLPPHNIIERTAKELGFELQLLDEKYFEKSGHQSSVEIYSFPDPESEVVYLRTLLSKLRPQRPDDLAVILPDSTILQALVRRLADLPIEVNITLPLKAKVLPLNNLLRQILRSQRERQENKYSLASILKILTNPLLRVLLPNHKNDFAKLQEALEKNLRIPEKSLLSIEELKESLDLTLKNFVEKFTDPLFSVWERVDSPQGLHSALLTFFKFIEPLTEGEDFFSILNKQFIGELFQKILPIFADSSLWIGFTPLNQDFLFRFLENLLFEIDLPLYGDPLAGLQIMGFLESRLLGFKKIVIFDTNEGSIPPKPSLNPLLTDEMKILLKLPIYRNELWDYYFKNLIHSGDQVFLFFVKAEKGSLAEEPSRFLQRLIWESEKGTKKLRIDVFSWQVPSPKSRPAIPKSDEERAIILEIIKNWEVSRYLLETYLLCPVRFYLKYILSLEEKNDELREDLEIGNFIHKFFEVLFKSLAEFNQVKFRDLIDQDGWRDIFESLWEEMKPDKYFDPLSAYLSKKIAHTAIEKYLHYLSDLEKQGLLLESTVLGTEKKLKRSLNIPSDLSSHLGVSSITLTGRIDFLLMRKFPNSERHHIAFDFKTNPDKAIAPKILEKFLQSHPPDDYFSPETLNKVKKLFSSDLKNFQPLFYLYLLHHHINETLQDDYDRTISPNAGYITPTNFEEPESSLIPFPKISKSSAKSTISNHRKALELVNKMEEYIIWIIRHMVFSEAFYFAEEKDCRYCSYRMPCKALRSKE